MSSDHTTNDKLNNYIRVCGMWHVVCTEHILFLYLVSSMVSGQLVPDPTHTTMIFKQGKLPEVNVEPV